MTGDNSETNKRRKLEEVIGNIFLSYVGQNGSSDYLPPVFADHFTLLAINKLKRSGCSGEGWSKSAFIPNKQPI